MKLLYNKSYTAVINEEIFHNHTDKIGADLRNRPAEPDQRQIPKLSQEISKRHPNQIVAYNVGARDKERIMGTFRWGVLYGFAVMATASFCFLLFPEFPSAGKHSYFSFIDSAEEHHTDKIGADLRNRPAEPDQVLR